MLLNAGRAASRGRDEMGALENIFQRWAAFAFTRGDQEGERGEPSRTPSFHEADYDKNEEIVKDDKSSKEEETHGQGGGAVVVREYGQTRSKARLVVASQGSR